MIQINSTVAQVKENVTFTVVILLFPTAGLPLFFITSRSVVVSFVFKKSQGGIWSRKSAVPTRAFSGPEKYLQFVITTSFYLLLNSSYVIILSSLVI
jgi:hypothetical protein